MRERNKNDIELQHKCAEVVTLGCYGHPMEKEGFSPEGPMPPQRATLAEEQQRAFEEDQRRRRRSLAQRWPGFLFRN